MSAALKDAVHQLAATLARVARCLARVARCLVRVARRLLTLATYLLLPRPCLACNAHAERELGLCLNCRAQLVPPAATSRTGDELAGADRFYWLWQYQPPFDQVILGLKYRRLDYLGRHIADQAATELGAELGLASAVVPMPMHWRRRLVRGRNHAASIARPLARRLGRPLAPALRRRTLGRPQVGRSRRERLANPGVLFACRNPALVKGRVLLLVDDVVTTGATAGRAARLLKQAGAKQVIVFAAARTLDESPRPT